MALSQAEVDAAKAAHPSAVKVSIHDGAVELVVRRPTRAEWKMYRQSVLAPEPAKQAVAAENLFSCCCVVPDRQGIGALLDEHPAVIESTLPVLAKLAGFDAKATADFT